MTTQTAAVVVTGFISFAGILIAAFISKTAKDKPQESPYLKELTDILKRMEMWEKESRDDMKEVKADSTHIREKVDSDHDNIKKLGLEHKDQEIGIEMLGKNMDAFHRRLDALKINP